MTETPTIRVADPANLIGLLPSLIGHELTPGDVVAVTVTDSGQIGPVVRINVDELTIDVAQHVAQTLAPYGDSLILAGVEITDVDDRRNIEYFYALLNSRMFVTRVDGIWRDEDGEIFGCDDTAALEMHLAVGTAPLANRDAVLASVQAHQPVTLADGRPDEDTTRLAWQVLLNTDADMADAAVSMAARGVTDVQVRDRLLPMLADGSDPNRQGRLITLASRLPDSTRAADALAMVGIGLWATGSTVLATAVLERSGNRLANLILTAMSHLVDPREFLPATFAGLDKTTPYVGLPTA